MLRDLFARVVGVVSFFAGLFGEHESSGGSSTKSVAITARGQRIALALTALMDYDRAFEVVCDNDRERVKLTIETARESVETCETGDLSHLTHRCAALWSMDEYERSEARAEAAAALQHLIRQASAANTHHIH